MVAPLPAMRAHRNSMKKGLGPHFLAVRAQGERGGNGDLTKDLHADRERLDDAGSSSGGNGSSCEPQRRWVGNRNREGEQRWDPKIPDNHARHVLKWRMVD